MIAVRLERTQLGIQTGPPNLLQPILAAARGFWLGLQFRSHMSLLDCRSNPATRLCSRLLTKPDTIRTTALRACPRARESFHDDRKRYAAGSGC